VFCPMINPGSPLIAFWLWCNRRKYVVIVHDGVPHSGEDSFWRVCFHRVSLWWVDSFIVLSDAVRKDLTKITKKPIFRGAHGSLFDNDVVNTKTLPSSPLTLGLIGRIHAYKGVDQFLKLLIVLHRGGTACRGIIAGYGALNSSQKKACSESPLFELHNRWLSDAEFKQFVARCDIVVLPYQDASQSGVISVANQLGVPVIVTPVGGLREQVIDRMTGLVAADKDEYSLADAVNTLVADPDLYENISTNQLSESKKNDGWFRIANHFVSHYALSGDRV